MSKEDDNKAVVVRWFIEGWGENVNLGVVDDIAGLDDGVTALTPARSSQGLVTEVSRVP